MTGRPEPPEISLVRLLGEAARAARSAKVPTALVALLVALASVTTAMTVGRADAAEAQVAGRMDEAGSRLLRVTDVHDVELLPPDLVRQIATLSTAERVVGLGPVSDVVNLAIGTGGDRVPASTVTHGLADAVELTSGRWPGPGEGLVTEAAAGTLGLVDLVGTVTTVSVTGRGTQQVGVVGTYVPRAPFGDLTGALVLDPKRPARTVVIIASDAAVAPVTEQAVLAVIGAPDPSALRVDSPVTLAQTRGEIVGDLAAFGRGLLVLVLGSGAFLVTVVVFADTLTRRVDLGRRRALGAPRWLLVVLVVGRTGMAAILGGSLGAGVSLVIARGTGLEVQPGFVAGTAVLTVLAALVAAVPPAVLAAYQDPVRVLRTP